MKKRKEREQKILRDIEQIRTKNYFLPSILFHADAYDWFLVAQPILFHEEYQKRKFFKHHEKESVYEHSIKVSLLSYQLAKMFHANVENCVIAGLLHDFYTHAWQYSDELQQLDFVYQENLYKRLPLFQKHGFVHPYEAAKNAHEYFGNLMNERISDAILKHMFPISVCTPYRLPKYKESWIVTIADKIVSIRETSFRSLSKYLGFTR